MSRKISNFYFGITKFIDDAVEKIIIKDLEKEKRNFEKCYSIEPSEFDLKEIRKGIVLRKGLYTFMISFLAISLIYIIITSR